MASEQLQRDKELRESLARLQLFEQVAKELRTALKEGGVDELRGIRDALTHWAPWTIKLPVWEDAYAALASGSNRAEFLGELERMSSAIEKLLQSHEGDVPSSLFGNVTDDVSRIRSSAA